jgi:hypothetical protein
MAPGCYLKHHTCRGLPPQALWKPSCLEQHPVGRMSAAAAAGTHRHPNNQGQLPHQVCSMAQRLTEQLKWTPHAARTTSSSSSTWGQHSRPLGSFVSSLNPAQLQPSMTSWQSCQVQQLRQMALQLQQHSMLLAAAPAAAAPTHRFACLARRAPATPCQGLHRVLAQACWPPP